MTESGWDMVDRLLDPETVALVRCRDRGNIVLKVTEKSGAYAISWGDRSAQCEGHPHIVTHELIASIIRHHRRSKRFKEWRTALTAEGATLLDAKSPYPQASPFR